MRWTTFIFTASLLALGAAADPKLAPSALREAVSGRAYARLNIVFREGVSFDDAERAILSAGGAIDRPLQTDFDLPRNIRAHVPASAVARLADDDRVFTMHGPLRAMSDNLDAAHTAHADVVQSAPYGLDGSGITMSYFELSPGDASHIEFGGRLTLHFPENASHSDTPHATHTAGTMIAKGINPQAKGMAPAATLHGYYVDELDEWINVKRGVVSTVDNNSWGFVLGWCDAICGSPTHWLWVGNDEYIGGYDSHAAAIDEIARISGKLMVHSAGNTGATNGPQSAPFAHDHDGESGTFCYSANGSGNDCLPPCSSGLAHCEIVRHPTHGAVGSIGLTASAKNVVAVGATNAEREIQSFSSRGPTRDGRVKPDLTAKGLDTFSTFPNNSYATLPGTSMAAPVVSGIAALTTQQWRKTVSNTSDPSPAMLKALLIAGAADTGEPGPDYANGFGAVDAKRTVDLVIGRRFAGGWVLPDGRVEFALTLASPDDLRVVLVWTDPEVILDGNDLAAATLVNDLDLVVKDPNGNDVLPYVLDPKQPFARATRGVNKVDNVEEVEIAGAGAGTYHVIVNGTRMKSAQEFALVATAGAFVTSAPDRRRVARH